MLEVEGAMERIWSMSSLPSNEFLDSVFKKEDLIEDLRSHGLLHCHKQLFVGFEISGGSYDRPQNLSHKK